MSSLLKSNPPHRSASTANTAIHRSSEDRDQEKDRDRAFFPGSFRSTLDSLMLHIIPPICPKISTPPTDAVSPLDLQWQRVWCYSAPAAEDNVAILCIRSSRHIDGQGHRFVGTQQETRQELGLKLISHVIGLNRGPGFTENFRECQNAAAAF